jgi:hypothetical protein
MYCVYCVVGKGKGKEKEKGLKGIQKDKKIKKDKKENPAHLCPRAGSNRLTFCTFITYINHEGWASNPRGP